jgi:hypothetical protein
VIGARGVGFVQELGITAGDDADLAADPLVLRAAQHVDAASVGQHQVEQNPLRPRTEAMNRLGDRRGFRYDKPLPLQNARDR